MYFVYILQCADGSLYAGCTEDLKRRLHEHNHTKKGAKYTTYRRPAVLKYSESFRTLLRARRREAELKRWPHAKKLRLIRSVLR